MIVNSRGPSASEYPAGKKLADDAVITLIEDDAVLLLDKGGTRILTGPKTVKLSAPSETRRERAKLLIRSLRSTRSSRAGVVRGPQPMPGGRNTGSVGRPETFWFADMEKGGGVCVAEKARLTLFRRRAGRAAHLMLQPREGGEAHLVYMPESANTVPWPATTSQTEKAWMLVDQEALDGPAKATFYIRRIAVSDDDPIAFIEQLMLSGCDAQLDYALRFMDRGKITPAMRDTLNDHSSAVRDDAAPVM